MKTLLLNPMPGFSECVQIDRWMATQRLALTDVAFRFSDLDGDGDPSVPDVGVRGEMPSEAFAFASDEELTLPRIVRGGWRILRDEAGGERPSREDRMRLLSIALRAARLLGEGADLLAIADEVRDLHDISEGIMRRQQQAEHEHTRRRMAEASVNWRGDMLRVSHLTVESGFDARAAFQCLPGLKLLVAHDARTAKTRTAVMARKKFDLTELIDALYARLKALEPASWELLRDVKPGPSPMILPARRGEIASNIGGMANGMFDLVRECAA